MNLLCVRCRTEAQNFPLLHKEHDYFINSNSLYIDCDGDAYVDCYTVLGKYIGRLCVKHFYSC